MYVYFQWVAVMNREKGGGKGNEDDVTDVDLLFCVCEKRVNVDFHNYDMEQNTRYRVKYVQTRCFVPTQQQRPQSSVSFCLSCVFFRRQVSSETAMWSPRPSMMLSCSWGATTPEGERGTETGRGREMAAGRWWAHVQTTQSTHTHSSGPCVQSRRRVCISLRQHDGTKTEKSTCQGRYI